MRPTRMIVALAFAATLASSAYLCGCGQDDSRTTPTRQQGVSDVLEEQSQAQGDKETGSNDREAFVGDAGPGYASVDYDLTSMSSDMVYATVYDMVSDPGAYAGKVVRMRGPYYHTFYEPTGKDYFYVVIQDATACCAQGLEFVWGDGTHMFPQDYPADETEVVVTGVFETYDEDGTKYVRLVDASMEAA